MQEMWINSGTYRQLDELRELHRRRQRQGRNDAIVTAIIAAVLVGIYLALR